MSNFEHFVGTQAVPASRNFDVQALSHWMSKNVAGFAGPLEVQMFKGGQSNPTYKLQTAQCSYVMRSKPAPAAKLLPSAHAIEREYRVMSSLAETNVPVPRMYALCMDESVIGRAFYIMECKEGRVLWDQALPNMQPTLRSEIYDAMNQTIAALHCVDVSQVGLADYGKPGNYFERQIARWSKQYLASVTEPIVEMDHLMDWLPAHLPASAKDESRVSIVHGDYRLDNLMFGQDSAGIVAVLDWELSTLGHPLADFSYHCMAWHIPASLGRGIAGLDIEVLGIPSEASYIRSYCERTGLTTPEQLQTDWNYYLAYNMFRIAAILQGIAKRAQEGIASSDQAKATGDTAHLVAQLAWKYAQKHRI